MMNARRISTKPQHLASTPRGRRFVAAPIQEEVPKLERTTLRVADAEAWSVVALRSPTLGAIIAQTPEPLGFGVQVVCDFEFSGKTIRCGAFVTQVLSHGKDGAPSLLELRLMDLSLADMKIIRLACD